MMRFYCCLLLIKLSLISTSDTATSIQSECSAVLHALVKFDVNLFHANIQLLPNEDLGILVFIWRLTLLGFYLFTFCVFVFFSCLRGLLAYNSNILFLHLGLITSLIWGTVS